MAKITEVFVYQATNPEDRQKLALFKIYFKSKKYSMNDFFRRLVDTYLKENNIEEWAEKTGVSKKIKKTP